MIPKKHYNITVKGKVQGVWFRKFVDKAASNQGLFGFVKNIDDGNVFIEIECNLWEYTLFIDKIKKGSPLSRVSSVKVEEGEVQNFTFFEIRK